METFIVESESDSKAKELSNILSPMNFVKKVSSINKHRQMLIVLQEHEDIKAGIVKRKNKAIVKYL